jgi:hypothetical protein
MESELWLALWLVAGIVWAAWAVLLGGQRGPIRDDRIGDYERWNPENDPIRFSGLHVAVDWDTEEILGASADRSVVENDARYIHASRRVNIVSPPGNPSEPLRILLNVGPCVTDTEYRVADGE